MQASTPQGTFALSRLHKGQGFDWLCMLLCLPQVRGLSLADRFTFAMSPTNTRNPAATAALLSFAHSYANECPAPLRLGVPGRPPESPEELKVMEASYQVWPQYNMCLATKWDC